MAYGGVTNKHGRGIHEWTIQCVAVSPSGKSRADSIAPKAAALTTSSLNLPVIEVSMPVPAFGGRVDGVRWARAASMACESTPSPEFSNQRRRRERTPPTRQHPANASKLKSGRRAADRRAPSRPAPCARRPWTKARRRPRRGNTSSYQHQYACRRGCRRSASAGSSRRRRATPARGPCTRRAC